MDTTAVVAAPDRLGERAAAHCLEAARVTAERIAAEAQRRVRRRTGKTQESIVAELSRKGDAYLVRAHRSGLPHLPIWIEFGTRTTRAAPFLFPAARLEEGNHQRRIAEAVQRAIDDAGLGD